MAFYSVQSQLSPIRFSRRQKDGSYLSNWNLKRYNEYLQAKGDGVVNTSNRWNIRHRPSKESADKRLTVTPFLVDFQRVLKTPGIAEVVSGVPNRELLHSAVALYDVSLPEITPEILYTTVTEKWARTILLVREATEAAEEYKLRFAKGRLGRRRVRTQTTPVATRRKTEKDNHNCGATPIDSFPTESKKEEGEPLPLDVNVVSSDHRINGESYNGSLSNDADASDVSTIAGTDRFRAISSPTPRSKPETRDVATEVNGDDSEFESKVDDAADVADGEDVFETWDSLWADGDDAGADSGSKFRNVFSDSSSSSGSDQASDAEDDEDLSVGVKTFFKNVDRRRERRRKSKDGVVAENDDIGIENRLVGCATIEKSYCRPGEKIIHLTLVAVHRRHRRMGVGHKLIELIKDTSLFGTFDAIVVHADNGATEFFRKEGFDDDLIVNSRFSKLSDRWTNCTLMCFMPPFVGNTVLSSELKDEEAKAIRGQIDKWKGKSLEAYQALSTCLARLNEEVFSLRELVKKQEDAIACLQTENQKLQKSNRNLRESAREETVEDDVSGHGAELERQMKQITSVVREQVARRFKDARLSTAEDNSGDPE